MTERELELQREWDGAFPELTDAEREEAMVAEDAMAQAELQKTRDALLDDDKALAFWMRTRRGNA